METITVVIRYFLLVAYVGLGFWLATRKGRQIGMVRKRVRNREAHLLGWFVGFFIVMTIITPW